MNKQKGISTILSILLALLIVAGGVVAYNYYSTLEEKPSTGEPGEPQDETADWKTYRNEEYGFEVKYPEDWYEKHYYENDVIELQNIDGELYISTGGPCEGCVDEEGVRISFKVWDNTAPKLNLNDIITGPKYGDENTFSFQEININGLNAVKIIRLVGFGTGWPEVIISSNDKYGDKFFVISYAETVNSDDFSSVFEQMVYSFKLIDVKLLVPNIPVLSYLGDSATPYVQINWNYEIADYFNVYRAESERGPWEKIIELFPQSAHTAVDYNIPEDTGTLYYKITSADRDGNESEYSEISSVNIK